MVALLKDESLPPGQLFKCGGLVGLGPSKTSIGEIWVASALSGHKGVQIYRDYMREVVLAEFYARQGLNPDGSEIPGRVYDPNGWGALLFDSQDEILAVLQENDKDFVNKARDAKGLIGVHGAKDTGLTQFNDVGEAHKKIQAMTLSDLSSYRDHELEAAAKQKITAFMLTLPPATNKSARTVLKKRMGRLFSVLSITLPEAETPVKIMCGNERSGFIKNDEVDVEKILMQRRPYTLLDETTKQTVRDAVSVIKDRVLAGLSTPTDDMLKDLGVPMTAQETERAANPRKKAIDEMNLSRQRMACLTASQFATDKERKEAQLAESARTKLAADALSQRKKIDLAQAKERAVGAKEAKEKADKRAADIVEAYAKMRGKEEGQHKSTWKPKRFSPEIVDDWQCFKCDLSWYDCNMVRKHIT